jgi:hypothetical protein
MAQVSQASRQGDGAAGSSTTLGQSATNISFSETEKDKVLPLPGWLVKLYFIFPVVLYVPDVIFNYYVYSDGVAPQDNFALQILGYVLWGFLSVGVVGMAYLLSVLAPWHWGQGHRIQAFFCGLGVVIATAITTWNSLAYRGEGFRNFKTDEWAYNLWPQLQANNISITMILVAIAPPFWGLFWAIVQPTETGRSLRQLQESHEERMLRMQQEAELKRLKAETNAKVREAQLRGMAATAAAARQQAGALFNQKRDGENAEGEDQQAQDAADENGAMDASGEQSSEAPNVLQLPTLSPTNTRELTGSRGAANFFNHAAAATPGVHSAPAASVRPIAQPALLAEADVRGSGGMPGSDSVGFTSRRPPTLLGGLNSDVTELDGMTGTTGPRPAVRRTNELGSLARGMAGPSPRGMQTVEEAYKQLLATSTNKRVSDRELVSLSAEMLGVDDSTARTVVRSWREAKRGARS